MAGQRRFVDLRPVVCGRIREILKLHEQLFEQGRKILRPERMSSRACSRVLNESGQFEYERLGGKCSETNISSGARACVQCRIDIRPRGGSTASARCAGEMIVISDGHSGAARWAASFDPGSTLDTIAKDGAALRPPPRCSSRSAAKRVRASAISL